MNKKLMVTLGIVLVAVLIFGGFFLFGKQASAPKTENTTSGSSSTTTTPNSSSTDSASSNDNKTYSSSDVAKHKSESDCWTIIDGSVYDLTSFIPQHPGGSEILKACGIDATALFNGSDPNGRSGGHSAVAQEKLAELKIGTLKN